MSKLKRNRKQTWRIDRRKEERGERKEMKIDFAPVPTPTPDFRWRLKGWVNGFDIYSDPYRPMYILESIKFREAYQKCGIKRFFSFYLGIMPI